MCCSLFWLPGCSYTIKRVKCTKQPFRRKDARCSRLTCCNNRVDEDSRERQNSVVHDTVNSVKLDSRYLSAVGLPGLVNINNVCHKHNICLQVTGFTAALWY